MPKFSVWLPNFFIFSTTRHTVFIIPAKILNMYTSSFLNDAGRIASLTYEPSDGMSLFPFAFSTPLSFYPDWILIFKLSSSVIDHLFNTWPFDSTFFFHSLLSNLKLQLKS